MWNIVDITMHFECTDDQALYILDKTLSNEDLNDKIWETITMTNAKTLNLKPIE